MLVTSRSFGQYFPPGRVLPLLLGTQLVVAILLSFAVVSYPLWVFGALMAISAGIAVLVWADILTVFVFFVMYSNAAAIAVQFHGVPFIVGAAVPLLLMIPLANYIFLRHQKFVTHRILLLVFLFHLVQLIGTVFSRDINLAMPNLTRHLVEGLCFYFLIINVVRTPTTLRLILWSLLIAGALLGALGSYQVLTQTYDNAYWGFAQVSNAAFSTGDATLQGEVMQPRLAGAIGEQNRHAQAMLMLIPLGFFLFRSERSMLLRILLIAMTSLIALGIATTFSRGAALAFGIMVVVMVFMRYITLMQLLVVAVGLVLLLSVALPQYATRIIRLQGLVGLVSEQEDITTTTKPDGSLKNRSTEMLAAALVFADHPIIGVGPGMFHYYYGEYAEIIGENIQRADTRQAHNLYLSIAADTGLLGFVCFMGVIVLLLHDLAQTRKRLADSHPEIANIATGFILAIITYLATGIGLHFAFARFYWLFIGLASVVSYLVPQTIPQLSPVSSQANKQLVQNGAQQML